MARSLSRAELDLSLPASDVLRLLDALKDPPGAPVEEILNDLAGTLPADIAAALNKKSHALWAQLSHWRRRGHELSALFSSARELAQLRDADVLLHRLVERAHEFMDVDIMCLSEFQKENGELLIRSSFGSISEEFRRLRIPPGFGIASKVAQTRYPQWTSTYQTYTGVPHDSGIDIAVDLEGITSLLGVPLVAGEEVLGVLSAANRSERTFDPEEISLLSAFADHAAVILQTAQLLENAHKATQEAEETTGVLETHITDMTRADMVHETLTEVVLEGGQIESVVDTLSSALHRPVMALDKSLKPLCYTPEGWLYGATPSLGADDKVREAVEHSRTSGHCVPLRGEPQGLEVVVAVAARGSLLGALLVGSGELSLNNPDLRIVERAAQSSAFIIVQEEAVAAAAERVRGELVSDILRGGPTDWQQLHIRARSRDVDLYALNSVVVTTVQSEYHRLASETLQGSLGGALTGRCENLFVILAPNEDPMETAQVAYNSLQNLQSAPLLSIAGPNADSISGLAVSFRTAQRTVRLLEGLDIHEGTVNAQAFTPYLALFGEDRADLHAFIHATIGPVLDWDDRRGTELFKTLHAFTEAQASPSQTARRLHIHVNTATQRLSRIGELLGPDWRHQEKLFRITMATRLKALLRSTHAIAA